MGMAMRILVRPDVEPDTCMNCISLRDTFCTFDQVPDAAVEIKRRHVRLSHASDAVSFVPEVESVPDETTLHVDHDTHRRRQDHFSKLSKPHKKSIPGPSS